MPAFLFVSGYFAGAAQAGPFQTGAAVSGVPVRPIFDGRAVRRPFRGDWLAALYAFQLFTPRWTLWYLLALMAYHLLLPLLETDDRRKMARNLLLAVLLGLAVAAIRTRTTCWPSRGSATLCRCSCWAITRRAAICWAI